MMTSHRDTQDPPKCEWMVTLFRKTHTRGWEQYVPKPKAFLVTKPKSTNTQIKNSLQAQVAQRIGVTPRKGWVEMKELRLRVTLHKQLSQKEAQSTTLVRRIDTVLLTTSRGGCICFKFDSMQECLSFWDTLVALNCKVNETPKCDSFAEQRSMCLKKTTGSDEFRNMLIRLMFEEDFVDLCDFLEQTLTSTGDGRALLESAARCGFKKVLEEDKGT